MITTRYMTYYDAVTVAADLLTHYPGVRYARVFINLTPLRRIATRSEPEWIVEHANPEHANGISCIISPEHYAGLQRYGFLNWARRDDSQQQQQQQPKPLATALAASSDQVALRCAVAVMEDHRTTVVVDTPSADVYRYQLVRDGVAVGVAVTSWPPDAVELLAHDGRWYPVSLEPPV